MSGLRDGQKGRHGSGLHENLKGKHCQGLYSFVEISTWKVGAKYSLGRYENTERADMKFMLMSIQ